ncbi:hypothetical protein [Polaromonas naphthalenivorans]|uniref:Transmembrane protein n=1 Tax=Polaromonas naphthalenivorans (strain CJ2) TaxID=365044 RepID=A1VW99_POLNA|nr:hypothetical protein [Polaromonas naphthalenivorans]ABM39927.1 hypothetical protein Pnap_4863 [Polaromonas naphthalenivorans CJ2]
MSFEYITVGMNGTIVKNLKFLDLREQKYGANKPKTMSQIDHKNVAFSQSDMEILVIAGKKNLSIAERGNSSIFSEDRAKKAADAADTAAKATRVIAAVAGAGASVLAPTGLSAVGVALGLVSTPLIVTAVPILVAIAGGAAVVSAAASLHSKMKRKK